MNMQKAQYKISKTKTGVLLSILSNNNQFIITDAQVKKSLSTDKLVVRYMIPGKNVTDNVQQGICVLSGDEVLKAIDRWLNAEYDHAVMILLPLMVESVKMALHSSESFLNNWHKNHNGELYKVALN